LFIKGLASLLPVFQRFTSFTFMNPLIPDKYLKNQRFYRKLSLFPYINAA